MFLEWVHTTEGRTLGTLISLCLFPLPSLSLSLSISTHHPLCGQMPVDPDGARGGMSAKRQDSVTFGFLINDK
jgi:hypothetical protein